MQVREPQTLRRVAQHCRKMQATQTGCCFCVEYRKQNILSGNHQWPPLLKLCHRHHTEFSSRPFRKAPPTVVLTPPPSWFRHQ